MEGPHREVVGATVVNSKLFCKVIKGVEAVAGIKAFLVLPVATFHLTVVTRGIGTNQFVPDT